MADGSRERTAVRMGRCLINRNPAQYFSVSVRRVAALTAVVLALVATSLCSAADVGARPAGISRSSITYCNS